MFGVSPIPNPVPTTNNITTLTTNLAAEVTNRKAGDANTLLQAEGYTDQYVAAHPAGPFTSAQAAALQGFSTVAPFFSLNGDADVFLTGANLHIVDGGDNTTTIVPDPDGSGNGLDNLIVGYNSEITGSSKHTGSHNIVVGDLNSYTSYGGLVAGFGNTISGVYATVSGGDDNTASGNSATVNGGQLNATNSAAASVSGGNNNIASGYIASVSGGQYNTASGASASVSGGGSNTASGASASVSGGQYSTVSGTSASVSGGTFINQNNLSGWSGGSYHTP